MNNSVPAIKPGVIISPIMEELRLRVVLFVDIGGYLFPDRPHEWTAPNELVLRLTKAHCQLWGPASCFIAANISGKGDRQYTDELNDLHRGLGIQPDDPIDYAERIRQSGNLSKDLGLLKQFDVYGRTGIINHPNHFYACYGPEMKGPELRSKAAVISKQGYKVLKVICDNSLRVACFATEETHCFIYQEKDARDPAVIEWLKEPRPLLYRYNNVRDIAQKTAAVHLEFVRNAALSRPARERADLTRLYRQEVNRTVEIFWRNRFEIKRSLPKALFSL